MTFVYRVGAAKREGGFLRFSLDLIGSNLAPSYKNHEAKSRCMLPLHYKDFSVRCTDGGGWLNDTQTDILQETKALP